MAVWQLSWQEELGMSLRGLTSVPRLPWALWEAPLPPTYRVALLEGSMTSDQTR